MKATLALRSRTRVRAAGACMVVGLVLAAMPSARGGESPGGFRFVVYGGTEGAGQAHRTMAAQIAKLRPHVVVHAGGMVGTRGRSRQWKAFHDFTEPVFQAASFYGCRGRGEGSGYCQAKDGHPEPSMRGSSYCSFDVQGVHFVLLDTTVPADFNDPQTSWLAADLEKARGRPILVFGHDAVVGCGGRHMVHNGRLCWHPLFVKNKVSAVFSGARNLYHRTRQDGVAYVVTGGGGGTLDPVMARRQLIPSDVAGSFFHCIEVGLGPQALHCRVVDSEGRTRDEFDIPVPAPQAQARR